MVTVMIDPLGMSELGEVTLSWVKLDMTRQLRLMRVVEAEHTADSNVTSAGKVITKEPSAAGM
jgi:hypothetical protein